MGKEIVTTVCDNKNNNQLYLPRVDMHIAVPWEIKWPSFKRLQ